MLTISSALNAGQAATYHKLDYASSTQSYYQQGEEVRGEWRGELAASLGLSGEVSSLAFNRLAEGQHPETGEQLVRTQGGPGVQKPRRFDYESGRAPGRMGCPVRPFQVRLPDGPGGRG